MYKTNDDEVIIIIDPTLGSRGMKKDKELY